RELRTKTANLVDDRRRCERCCRLRRFRSGTRGGAVGIEHCHTSSVSLPSWSRPEVTVSTRRRSAKHHRLEVAATLRHFRCMISRGVHLGRFAAGGASSTPAPVQAFVPSGKPVPPT